MRIRLPWAKRQTVVLDYFEDFTTILTNLKDDRDKSIQKSVANNLNDLYKEDPDKFERILQTWQRVLFETSSIPLPYYSIKTYSSHLFLYPISLD